ncbi:MAG: hypothetical protein HDR26_02860 [Lachnospiraceae bacterium]|nr:hypothetical protein [Lachnospiraceae bacterium]
MGTETKPKPPRALWISLAAAALSAAVFLWAVLFEYLMNPQRIYLRSNLKFYAGTVNLLFILPTAVFVSLLIFLVYLKKRRSGGKGVITGLIIFGSVVYGMFFLWAAVSALVLGAVNIMRGDYVGENGWLMEWHGPWGEAEGAWYTYFEEYNWLWKKEYYATENSVRQEIEERYGTQITPVGTTAGQEGWGVYTFAAEEDPAFVFRVQPSDQREFKEDFVQACADMVMGTVMEEVYPQRTWSTAYADQGQGFDGESSRFETGFVIECADLDDARVCAEIVAHLAEEALKSDYTADYGALIVVRCAGVEKWAADAAFPIGKNRLGDRPEYVWEGDRYTDWSLVYARLLDNYTWNLAGDGQESSADLESSAFYVEGAYRFLYDTLFADAGYPYKPAYSAKGSFYAYLTESTGSLESTEERMNTVETVVYDRESKNGKCHLFVHYRDYYEIGANAPYSTEIVDMYAVEMATGQVFVSGRHAWADLGSQEYQEATGEP